MPRKRKPLGQLDVLGAFLFFAGMAAWAWLGDWRWALTGTIALLFCFVWQNHRDGAL